MPIYNIDPVAKPRMTLRDKWHTRPATSKYWAFKNRCNQLGLKIPDGWHVIFYVPMPQSWSKKKKAVHYLRPHRQVPDVDNFLKGVLDAIYEDDAHIHDVRATKYWDYTGRIDVRPITGGVLV